jgi:hypothetical protein
MPMLSLRVTSAPKDFLDRLPRVVPGVKVRGAVVYVPDHGIACVYRALEAFGAKAEPISTPPPRRWGNPEEVGFKIACRLEREGVLRPQEPEKLTRYQREGVGLACVRGNFHLWWPPGAGKTFGGLLWALSVPGDVVWATRAGAVWTSAAEIRQRTTLDPHVWVAPSNRRKTYEDVRKYEQRTRNQSRRLYVVGYENLPDIEECGDLAVMDTRSLILDEIHRVRSHKRWDAVLDVDGKPDYQRKDNQAAVVMSLAKTARRRLGLTGSPIPDRVRGLWAPLDLVEPWGWGKFYDWAFRYCAAHEGAFGGMETGGSSYLGELEERLRYVTHVVDPEEVAASLPPFRRQVIRLRPQDLLQPLDGWKSKLKPALLEGGDDGMGANLMITASRKRRWVSEYVGDALRAGQKVLVLTGLRRDAEALAALIAKEAPNAWVRWTHGEHDAQDRQEMVDVYMALPSAACICATGDSIGESMNIQDTDLLVLAMIPWTPAQVIQWEGRVRGRLGQKRSVLIVYVVALGTVDERVAWALIEKLPVVGQLTLSSTAGDIATALRGVDDIEAELDRIVGALPVGKAWSVDESDDGNNVE